MLAHLRARRRSAGRARCDDALEAARSARPNASRYAPDAAGKTPSSKTAPSPNSAGTNGRPPETSHGGAGAERDAAERQRARSRPASPPPPRARREVVVFLRRCQKRLSHLMTRCERRASSELASSERASRALASSTTRTVVPAPVPKKLPLARGRGTTTRAGPSPRPSPARRTSSPPRRSRGPPRARSSRTRHDALAPTETRDTGVRGKRRRAGPSGRDAAGSSYPAAGRRAARRRPSRRRRPPEGGRRPPRQCAASASSSRRRGGARTRSARWTATAPGTANAGLPVEEAVGVQHGLRAPPSAAATRKRNRQNVGVDARIRARDEYRHRRRQQGLPTEQQIPPPERLGAGEHRVLAETAAGWSAVPAPRALPTPPPPVP